MILTCQCSHCGEQFDAGPEGGHRILCGDSTNPDDVERVLGGVKPHLMVTDPPYGVDFERGKYTGQKIKGQQHAPIANDDLKGDALTSFITAAMTCAFDGLQDGAPVYVWSPSMDEAWAIKTGVEAAGFKIQSQIVWRKSSFVMGRCDYHWQHELCWYGFKGANHPWYGARNKGSVWDCQKTHNNDLHPTMKPVLLFTTAIENSSKAGDVVLDIFAGAGPLVLACESSGRCAYMLELNPVYCDVIIQRWAEFVGAGATAILDGDGRDFDAVTAERMRVAA